MALYGSVLRPKKVPRLDADRAGIAQMGANPAGSAPPPQAMAFGGGAPPSLGNQRPRTPGAIAPTTAARDAAVIGRPAAGQGATTVGGRPIGQPMQPTPRPMPTPTQPPPAEAPGTAVTGTTGTAPPPATTQDDIDQMIRDLVASQIGAAGKVNTAEEEALIRQQMQGELGQSLVDQRARMGRAGFGASGAMGAIEGDVRRAAEMDALDQILGLRRTEEQRALDNAFGAVGVETGMRRAAADDALRRMALEALQAEMGLDAGPGPTDVGNAPGGGTVIMPADENGDGTVSVQEQQRYDQGTVEPYMAGSQAASTYFNNGGDANALPAQPPGGDVIVIRNPRVDADGNERPGVTYNTKTGQLGRF